MKFRANSLIVPVLQRILIIDLSEHVVPVGAMLPRGQHLQPEFRGTEIPGLGRQGGMPGGMPGGRISTGGGSQLATEYIQHEKNTDFFCLI